MEEFFRNETTKPHSSVSSLFLPVLVLILGLVIIFCSSFVIYVYKRDPEFKSFLIEMRETKDKAEYETL